MSLLYTRVGEQRLGPAQQNVIVQALYIYLACRGKRGRPQSVVLGVCGFHRTLIESIVSFPTDLAISSQSDS